jgi:transposase
MSSLPSVILPESPDALRDLVLSLLRQQEEREFQWAQIAAQKDQHIAARDATILRLETTIAKLERWRFGKRSEKLSPNQIQLWEETLDTEVAAVETAIDALPAAGDSIPSRQRPRRHPGRTPLPDTLPREEIHHDPEHCTCPQCGGALIRVGDEITEKLDFVPGHFRVLRHIRPKLVCRPCSAIESPALPAQVIDKGRPTARLVAQVIAAKYLDHLPLYRQETMYARLGVEISRATLSGWVGQGEYWLNILAGACKAALLQGQILHADETPLPVLEPGSGKTRKAYLWVYRSQADARYPMVVFDYAPDRKGIRPQAFLGDWQGILQTDDYAGYDALYRQGKVIEAGCWAHVRRHFYDVNQVAPSAVAQAALLRIAKLYEIEAQIQDEPPERKAILRQQRAGPLLESFHAWLTEVQRQVAPKSAIAKAIQYALKRWSALTRYLEEGYLHIDNNPVERAIRGVAIGRKNFLFAGNDAGGERAASIYTLIETCKLNGVEPFAYLCEVLEKLPTWPNRRLHELLPFHWRKQPSVA